MLCPCSENKGADQLRSNCEADLCLCFPIGKNVLFFFSRQGSLLKLVRNRSFLYPLSVPLQMADCAKN